MGSNVIVKEYKIKDIQNLRKIYINPHFMANVYIMPTSEKDIITVSRDVHDFPIEEKGDPYHIKQYFDEFQVSSLSEPEIKSDYPELINNICNEIDTKEDVVIGGISITALIKGDLLDYTQDIYVNVPRQIETIYINLDFGGLVYIGRTNIKEITVNTKKGHIIFDNNHDHYYGIHETITDNTKQTITAETLKGNIILNHINAKVMVPKSINGKIFIIESKFSNGTDIAMPKENIFIDNYSINQGKKEGYKKITEDSLGKPYILELCGQRTIKDNIDINNSARDKASNYAKK